MIELMLTIDPPPVFAICCAARLVPRKTLVWFTAMIRCHHHRRELRRGAELIAVEPQVFDLLVYLVQNRHRVVSKDDLVEAVWGGRIVSESTLTSRVNAVRKAIGDS